MLVRFQHRFNSIRFVMEKVCAAFAEFTEKFSTNNISLWQQLQQQQQPFYWPFALIKENSTLRGLWEITVAQRTVFLCFLFFTALFAWLVVAIFSITWPIWTHSLHICVHWLFFNNFPMGVGFQHTHTQTNCHYIENYTIPNENKNFSNTF